MTTRFAHTNVVARDWRALAEFYIAVFGCRVKPPPRQQSGDWLARGTGVPGAALEGVHLLLPGHGEAGPTLEVYSYSTPLDAPAGVANRRGFGHIAFEVNDVGRTVEAVVAHGGQLAGQIAERAIEGVGTITFVYARDPESNLVEIQSWDRSRC
jgi:catechol 2,3-dioxygenase-like lactoylglutathione lyase family enzyme